MKFLSLEYIKKHSRIEYDCEDALLEAYGDAAEETLAGYIGRGDTVEAMMTSLTEQYGKIPASIYIAGLMLVDLSYTHRSPVSPQQLYVIPYAFDRMVKPYMKL